MIRLIQLFSISLVIALVGCVPAPATIPSPSVPTIPTPSLPIPTPSDGMPNPPSIPGLPSPSNDSPSSPSSPSSSSIPQPLPGGGASTEPGDQSSEGEAEGADVNSEEPEGDGQEPGAETEPGTGTGDSATESDNVSLEDSASAAEAEPTFEEPTFEESSASDASASRGGLDQQTLEELERVLNQELGTFDSSINREQRNAEEQSSEPTGGPVPVIVFEDYPEEVYSPRGSGGGSGAVEGEGSGGGGGGGEGNVSVAVQDANIPPPNPDDDIVARQLREAAISETDPELKQRLWEEYNRYTGS
jgi:hypothetical protein